VAPTLKSPAWSPTPPEWQSFTKKCRDLAVRSSAMIGNGFMANAFSFELST
jgi:hypothetical protein